jgi:hypothetical protein
MCAAGYKRHGYGIIPQGAAWDGEDAIFCFLKGAGQRKDTGQEDGHERMRAVGNWEKCSAS